MDIFTQRIAPKQQRLFTDERFQRGLGPAKDPNPIAHALKAVEKMQSRRPVTGQDLARRGKRLGMDALRYGASKLPLKKLKNDIGSAIRASSMGMPGYGLKLAGQGLAMAGGCKYGACPAEVKVAMLERKMKQQGEGRGGRNAEIKRLSQQIAKTQTGRGVKKFIKQFPERLTTTAMTGYPAIIPGTPVLSELVGRGPAEHTGYAKGVLVMRQGQAGTGISMPTFKGIVASGCDWAVGKLVDTLEEMSGYDLSAAEARINEYTKMAEDALAQGESVMEEGQQAISQTAGVDPYSQFGFGIAGDLRKELKKLVPRFRKDIGQYALMAANKILPKLGLDPRENPGIQRALTQGIGRISRQAINGQRGEGFMKSLKNLGNNIVKGLKKGTKSVKKFIAKNPELMSALQTAGAVAPVLMMM